MKGRTILTEPSAFARIEGHLHENNGGHAYVKNYASVNKMPRVDSADRSRKYFGVTIETNIKEDNNVNDDDSFYCKDVKTLQTRDGDINNNNGNDSYSKSKPAEPSTFNDVHDGNKMDKADYLKNMHDNHLEDHRTWKANSKLWLLWLLGGCAFLLGVVAIVLISTM